MATGIGAAAAVHKVVFRTQAAPLRPSGLQFLARRASDTALLRAESQNDGSISGGFDAADTVGALIQPGSSGSYSLPIIPVSTAGGSAAGSVVIINTTSTNGLMSENFKVYPNPANQQITLVSSEEIINLKIISLAGKIVIEENNLEQNPTVNLQELKAGVYLVNVKTKLGIVTKKLIVTD